MKQKLLLALSVLLTLFACQQTELTPEINTDEVSFKSQISAASRVADNMFETGDVISVAAYQNNVEYDITDYIYGGSTFTSTSPIVKSQSDVELSYTAVYPAQDNDFGISDFLFYVQGDQSKEGNYELSDLLVAQTTATSEMQPTLLFKHKLSSLQFTFKLLDGVSVLPSEVFVNAQTEVDCNTEVDNYIAQSAPALITPAQNGEMGKKVIVAPQTIAADDIFMYLTYDSEEFEVNFGKDVELESGWRYSYEVTIDAVTKTVTIEQIDASVNDWETDEFDTPLTATFVSSDYSNIRIYVDKGSWEGLFYVGLATMHEYPGDAVEFAETLLYYEDYWYGTDFTSPDNYYIFYNSGYISLSGGWTINPSTQYAIVACGIDDNGDITTNVAMLDVTTPGGEITGSIEFTVDEVGDESIIATATPSAEVGSYLYGAVTTERFEENFYGDEMAVANAVINTIEGIGCDLEDPDGVDVLSGVTTFDFDTRWSIKAETEYTLFVFGVNGQGLVTTNIAMATATTLPAEPLLYTDDMSLEVVSISDADIMVDVDKGSFNGNYFVGLSDKVYLSAEDVAADLMDTQLNFFQNDMGYVDNVIVFENNARVSMNIAWIINPYTYYMVVAFGIDDDGNIYTNIANEVVRTSEFFYGGSIDVTLQSVGTESIVINCKPSEEIGNYMYGCIPTADLTTYYSDDAQAAAQEMVDQLYYAGYQMMYANGYYILQGEYTIDVGGFWQVDADTQYTVMAFGINTTPTVNSDVTTIEVTTLATGSSAPASFIERTNFVPVLSVIDPAGANTALGCRRESVQIPQQITQKSAAKLELAPVIRK